VELNSAEEVLVPRQRGGTRGKGGKDGVGPDPGDGSVTILPSKHVFRPEPYEKIIILEQTLSLKGGKLGGGKSTAIKKKLRPSASRQAKRTARW